METKKKFSISTVIKNYSSSQLVFCFVLVAIYVPFHKQFEIIIQSVFIDKFLKYCDKNIITDLVFVIILIYSLFTWSKKLRRENRLPTVSGFIIFVLMLSLYLYYRAGFAKFSNN